MYKKTLINTITTVIVLAAVIACMIITIVYGNSIERKLKIIENDIKKRPTIEYHYYEKEIPKVKRSK